MLDIIFISIGTVILLIFLFSVSVIHIRTIRDNLSIKWDYLAEKLQYRQDLLPLLIETVEGFVEKGNEEFEKRRKILIEVRSRAGMKNEPGMKKIVVEHDLSKRIEDFVYIGGTIAKVKKDTTFLEVTKELKDIREDIQNLVHEYNEKIRHHNKIVLKFWNRLPALALRYGKKKIFEFE